MTYTVNFRDQIISEARGLTDDEDRHLRNDDIDFSQGTLWGLATRLAELRGCAINDAFDVLV